jgi:hypothetical protein
MKSTHFTILLIESCNVALWQVKLRPCLKNPTWWSFIQIVAYSTTPLEMLLEQYNELKPNTLDPSILGSPYVQTQLLLN